MNDVTLIPIRQFYLMAIAALLCDHKLDSVLEEKAPGNAAGRLWLIRQRSTSTAPLGWVAFQFEENDVRFQCGFRSDNATWNFSCSYSEGIDSFLERLDRSLKEGALPPPKKTQ
jgi:hypothetical protein